MSSGPIVSLRFALVFNTIMGCQIMLRYKSTDALLFTPALLILAVWVLVSFFPLASAGMAWGSWWVLGHLVFLATGFPGLFAGYLVFAWASRAPIAKPDPERFRSRWAVASAYALIWLLAYWFFVRFT
ncbi:MAG: hypothetical protein AAGF20_13590 [Pseudomonadota bacterium]